jgi:KaiC/GvpD/RAD55 family RecA-like ATPase
LGGEVMGSLKVSTMGIPLLDSLLGGGFLSNSIVVVSFQPGVKMRQFGLHLGLKKFEEKLHPITVTFRYSIRESIDVVKFSLTNPELNKKINEIHPVSRFTVIDCFNITGSEEDSKIGNIYHVSNPFNVEELLSAMANARRSIPEDEQVYWIFYDLTNMSIGVPENELVKFCRRAFRYHKQLGDQAFYYLNEKAHTDTFFAKIYQLSDVFIKLLAEETPTGQRNAVQVIKGVFPFNSKKVIFEINENGEKKVTNNKLDTKTATLAENISTVEYFKREKHLKNLKIIRTGIPRLDSLLGGGLLSNSIIIISQQYGVRILETLLQIFKNQFSEKTHLILVNFHFTPKMFDTLLKMLVETSEIQVLREKITYDNVSIIDCFNPSRSETDKQEGNVYYPVNPFDIDRLLSAIARVRSNISENKSVFWIFHSLTDMGIGVPEDKLLKFCRAAFRYHKQYGDLVLYTLIERAHSERFLAKLYQLSDIFIRLIGEDKPEGIETSLQILKGNFNYSSKKARYQLDEKNQIQFVED